MNLLGEIHGGPIEAATRLFYQTDRTIEESGRAPEDVIRKVSETYRSDGNYVPGFGHPVHRKDPRVTRIFEMVAQAQKKNIVSGRFMRWARLFEKILPRVFAKKEIPINIDGGGAAVLCEIGIPAETAMGFVCLSRGLGLMAHGFETLISKERLKSPMPPGLIHKHMTYSGPPPRTLPDWKYKERTKQKRRKGDRC
jgi:citrate synthase